MAVVTRPPVTPIAAALLALLAVACGKKPEPSPAPTASVAASAAPVATVEAEEPAGNPERGKQLVEHFECSRCHEGTGAPEATLEKQCFTCHVKIISGEFKGPKGAEARWHDRVLDLKDVPSLTASQKRFRRGWLVRFLLDPYDLRPRLGPTMPRLAMTREEARDIAAYLAGPDDAVTMGGDPPYPPAQPVAKPDFAGADLAHGRKLMEAKGCASCHVLTGVPALEGATAVMPGDKALATGVQLAPDLRHARDRLKPEAVIAWVSNPKAVKADTPMPDFALTKEEARDIAAYVLTTPLAAPEPHTIPARLPPLDRKVGFDEVSAKVFRRTCWHCHGEPDYAAGDGGPGNTGGFGFQPRGASFVDYGSVAGGWINDKRERHSLFEKTKDGTPRLLAALLARQAEEAGHVNPEVRGMPLGYPSLTPEDIQLVESWIVQGRPR